MKIAELVAAVKKRSPVAAKLADAHVQAVIATTMRELGTLVEGATEQEPAKVIGFGQFRVKMVAPKNKPDTVVRRVIFVPAKVKVGEKPAAKGKAKG